MDRALQDFTESVGRFDEALCDEPTFLVLTKQAVTVYERRPEQGETVAQLMTGVWFRSNETWGDGKERAIGELFADLDVPPAHVAGGEQGAAAKWAAIKRLAQDQ